MGQCGMGRDGMGWDGMEWDSVGWDGTAWDGMEWDGTGWVGMGRDWMGWDGVGWDWMGQSGMGWDGTVWDGMGQDGMVWDGTGRDGTGRESIPRLPTAPTHRDVGVAELQAVECPAGGGQEGGDGQGEGQATRRLAPDNLGLQKQMSGWSWAGQPRHHHGPPRGTPPRSCCPAPHTRSASGERYMLMVKTLQKSPRRARRICASAIRRVK